MTAWHNLSGQETALKLLSDPRSGLSSETAVKRLNDTGFNELTEKKRSSPLLIFLSQFKDAMIIVLLAAAVVSGLLGELSDALFILAILLMNAALSTSQEIKAEKAVATLKKLASSQATVIRDGEEKKILSRELVPGDLLVFDAGTRVQADARLIGSFSLKIDESSLTGESLPVEKNAETIVPENTPLAERNNMIYMGCSVVYGRGLALVVSTGMSTELGKIAKMIAEEPEEATPLQKKFEAFGKWLAVLVLIICAVIFLAGVLKGEPAGLMFLTAVSLAVAAIPEGLPAVITISLALGAYRMVKRHAIIRKLPAVETLGSVTVICSDKTGTLTQNKMTVRDIYCDDKTISVGEDLLIDAPAGLRLQVMAGLLCNDSKLTSDGTTGDPTEGALVLLALKAGITKEEAEKLYPRVNEIPFDSNRKMMTTVHSDPEGGYLAFSKGALGSILDASNVKDRKEIMRAADALAASGKRLLGLAYKKTSAPVADEKDLIFLGFVAMSDPPRPEVKQAVASCRSAHIRPVMITGDHRLTALSVARELGIASSEDEVMEGHEIEQASLQQLRQSVRKINVFARVSPEHKLRIVEALKLNGEIVAMTGDGVNDAPALKKADIGVAMGIMGTDVSKEASDLVLTDDNFATIVSAIEEGRGIYGNIKKFVRYMLSTNSGEVLTMLGALMLGMPLPLIPIQILWINLVTDGLPALALSVEPIEKDIMSSPPRDPKEKITSDGLLLSMLGIGVLMSAGTLLLFLYGLNHGGLIKARTLAFTVLSFFQMAHALNCRSLDKSIFKIGWFTNPYLLGAILSTVIVQIAVIYIPVLQGIFKTTAISVPELLLLTAIALTPIPIVEARKLFSPKRRTR